MDRIISERQRLIETINNLPEEDLVELSSFLDSLHRKSDQCRESNTQPAKFLTSISGLGHSGQRDVSEHDEEILQNEIHPVHGWSSKSDSSL